VSNREAETQVPADLGLFAGTDLSSRVERAERSPPEFRRRGVQASLLATRLASAAAGRDFAVVTTGPGSKSQQNVQRLGFQLLYARAILVGSRH
jgi:hypothetical protein